MSGVVLSITFCASALLSAINGLVAYRARTVVPTGAPIVLAAVGLTGWALAAAAIPQLRDPGWVTTLASVGVLGQCLIVVGHIRCTEAVTGCPWQPRRRSALLLAVEPLLVVAVLAAEPWLHLFFGGVHRSAGGFWQAGVGVGYALHIAYNYAVTLVASYRGLRFAHRRAAFPRGTMLWFSAFILPAVVANVVAIVVLRSFDLAVVGAALSTALLYCAVALRSLELLPIARAQLVDALADGVVVIDRNGYVADANEVGIAMIRGSAPHLTDPIGAEVDAIDPAFPPLEQADADFVFVSERLGLDLEIRTRMIHDRSGAFAGWVMIARDVTRYRLQHAALEAANERLREQIATIDRLRADLAEQAVRDALTGLHNRRYLMEVLAEGRGAEPVSVALIDVDHFKQVNDQYGHAAGDRVLVAVARLLSSGVRPGDVLARHGGEEFVLLLPGTTIAAAQERVDGLRHLVANTPIEVAGGTVTVSFSAGVASGYAHLDGDALLEAADHALYAAKRNGRDRVELATSAR